jgi:radical SAM superfamily enzyme YgiQ (UPF0313 family)
MVNLSFPSLRVDRLLRDLPWLVNSVRKSGLTIAVEAASDILRAAIRKKVTDGKLLDGVRAAYEAGWKHVKLYFMVGFPHEQPADIDGIFELSYAVSQERRRVGKGPAAVTSAVGWLVPKPFTPLQWMAQPRVEYFHAARERLLNLARWRRSAVQLRMQRPERSVLEAVLARGDRRLAPVIHAAWQRGARFDSSDEFFCPEHWDAAFKTAGVDPDFYAHRERGATELLPWDHISLHLPRGYLEKSYLDVLTAANSSPEPASTA